LTDSPAVPEISILNAPSVDEVLVGGVTTEAFTISEQVIAGAVRLTLADFEQELSVAVTV
jgi:hypothetical protein